MANNKSSTSVTRSKYGARWDQFYQGFDAHGKSQPLWDVSSQAASELDYTLFKEHLRPELPIVDLGCGTGRQTAYMRNKYAHAIGLDVSARAIDIAAQQYARPGLEFQLLTDASADFSQLHHRLGDCNVYIRGVLHQIESIELPGYCTALLSLLGASGTLYFIEVADSIRDYLAQGSGAFSRLPGPIKRTLISNFPPRGFSLATLHEVFPSEQFHLLAAGESELNTNIQFGADDPICIPAIYGVVRPINTLTEHDSND